MKPSTKRIDKKLDRMSDLVESLYIDAYDNGKNGTVKPEIFEEAKQALTQLMSEVVDEVLGKNDIELHDDELLDYPLTIRRHERTENELHKDRNQLRQEMRTRANQLLRGE